MKNELYFDIHLKEEIVEKYLDKLEKEKENIGYYNLPFQDISYLKKLDNFKQTNIVVIGIGGSSLGAKAVHNFLGECENRRKLFFLESTGPMSLKRTLRDLDLDDTLFLVISKSGSTIETMANFKYILSLKPLNNEGYIFITDEGSKLDKLGIRHNITTFHIPKNVGGRFSVLSPVGLVPFYLMGYDVQGFLDGAKKIYDKFFNNTEFTFSLIKKAFFYVKNFHKYKMNVLFSYSETLKEFTAWYVQLWAESLGKKQLHSEFNVGLTPIGLTGPVDQHSFLQLIVEGARDKTVTFIKIKDFYTHTKIPDITLDFLEEVDIINDIEFDELINLQADSTMEVLKKEHIPVDLIEMNGVDEYSIGELIFYFELLTSLAGVMFDINTYDQPGVEAGKKILKQKLKNLQIDKNRK